MEQLDVMPKRTNFKNVKIGEKLNQFSEKKSQKSNNFWHFEKFSENSIF